MNFKNNTAMKTNVITKNLFNPVALQLRAMNFIGEGLKEKSSMIIVPSTALDSMNLGVFGGLASLGKQVQQQSGS